MRITSLLLIVCLSACSSEGRFAPISNAPTASSFLDVWAFSDDNVWLVDGTSTIYRYDGSDWGTLEAGPGANVTCIYALSVSDVWLCSGRNVLRYDGTTFNSTDVAAGSGLSGVTDVWALSSTEAYAVGDDAIVARFDGTDWSGTIAGSPFKTSIWGTAADDIYAAGTFDVIHYDGVQWAEVDAIDSSGGEQVWGTGPTNVWVAAERDELYRFDGTSWTRVELENFIGEPAALWGSSPTDIWGVGNAGSISRYDGNRWEELSHQPIGSPFLRQLVAVHGSSASNVWAVGRELGTSGSIGIIYRLGR